MSKDPHPAGFPALGASVEREYAFTPERLANFGDLTEDLSPVHFDSDFAREGGFPDRIVHGFFASAIFSGLLGSRLPGPHSVINQFTIKLHRPVVVGDTVVFKVSVTQISEATRAVVLKLAATGPDGETVISGSAICSIPRRA